MRYFLILMFIVSSCKSSTEKQDELTTDQQEVNTTHAVMEEPVFESAADEKLALLQGTWYSTDDPASYLTVTDDQLFMGYEREDTGTDTYTITIAGKLPNDQASNPDTQYLILKQGEDTMTYAIENLTEDTLKLLYLPRGNFLNYSKKK